MTVNAFADVIVYIVQMVGDNQHIAIGSDFDGGFGAGSIPQGMDSIADLGQIFEVLANRGFRGKDMDSLMYGN